MCQYHNAYIVTMPFVTSVGIGTNVARIAAAARDMIFTCGTRRAGRALVENGHEVYHYQWQHHFFEWKNVSSCNNLLFLCGNYHASELRYVWQSTLHSVEKKDRDMTSIIGTYWTNFAKTGNPNKVSLRADDVNNGKDTAYWAKFNQSDGEMYMQLQVPGLSLSTDLWGTQCDLYDKLDGY